MQFLNGEISAVFDQNFDNQLYYACVRMDKYTQEGITYTSHTYTFDTSDMLSYSQLLHAVKQSNMEGFGLNTAEIKISYAIISTISGKPMLAVKFEHLSIYSPGDNSEAVFLFAVNNGQLYLTYAYDSWAKNNVTIFDNLIIMSGGSSGVGARWDCGSYIDETGHPISVYEMDTCGGFSLVEYERNLPWIDKETVPPDWANEYWFYFLTTSEGSFYSYEYDSDYPLEPEQLAILKYYLYKNGISFIDNVDDAINAAFEKNGISSKNIDIFDEWVALN